MTRAKVIQLGVIVLALGGIGFWAFRLLGLDEITAGIAAVAILVALVVGWTASYLFRVITGKMTFMEQRRRYRQEYERVTTAELQSRFESLSEEEKVPLIEELQGD